METRVMPAESLFIALGIKPSSIVAGFLGALMALPYMPNRSWWQKAWAVFNGLVCAVYLAPWVSNWLDLDATQHNGACFMVGIMGINITSGLFGLSDRFRRNPEGFFGRRK